MHVGFAPVFMNPSDSMSDLECFKHELALADLAEPLGFDSIWQPEHHFSGYEMTPNVLNFLTYMAGRTKTVRLGSMVVVLPWHSPLRVAEDVSLLDHYSNGRAILGIGRGLGAMEFAGFGIDMSDTRDMFVEKAEAVVRALKTGYIEYDGKHVKQPRRSIRPAPFKTFEGRTFGAGLSPETMPILAQLGAGPMIFPYKSWPDTRATLDVFKKHWQPLHPGTAPPKPVLVSFAYVNKDAGKAKDIAYKYIGGYLRIASKHYDMGGENFSKQKGYEFYADNAARFRDEMEQKVEEFVYNSPWGTPDMYLEKLKEIDGHIDMGAVLTHFAYSDMPYDLAEESMRFFAKAVLPELKKWDKGPFAEPRKVSQPAPVAAHA
jgi:alkanesulfonate monooxygenase SsuD/methylene tetrahydromethanopterin reductase-like flavin-dependent oxidoreductase (luciferase family)